MDLNSFSVFTNSTADYWKVKGDSNKILEISEDITSGTNTETLRNMTTTIGGTGGELKALASGTVNNSKGDAPYNQYLYLLGPGTGVQSGYVKYTEDNHATTADFLYFKAETEIGKYVLEFTTALKSGIYDTSGNNSTSGLFLNDFLNTTLRILGKNYVITSAQRITSNGGSINLTLVNGTQKLELSDNDITDVASTNNLKVNDTSISKAPVIIEGTDDNVTFKINRITVNMTAEDNLYVPAGQRLSQNTDLRKPQVLFTQNWDFAYGGLKNENTEKIKLKTNGASEYDLEFVDGDGNKVSVPIAKATGGSSLRFGELDGSKAFINNENTSISKDDYFIVTNATAIRGSSPTYAFQYKGADKLTIDGHVMRFKNLGDGTTTQLNYSNSTPLAYLTLNGTRHGVYVDNNADINQNDFNIRLDLDGDNILNGSLTSNIIITTKNGAEINLTNQSGVTDTIQLGIRTPDDSRDTGKYIYTVENITAIVNVTNGSGNVTIESKETIKIYTQGDNIYYLEFKDRDGNMVSLPIAENGTNNTIFFGQINKSLINKETGIIKKNYYFVVTDTSQDRGKRWTYALQYLGADRITADSPVLRFKNLGSGTTFQQSYSNNTPLAELKLGGKSFKVYKSQNADISVDDFDIQVDLDANGSLSSDSGYTIPITTYPKGVEINLSNETLPNTIQITIRTFDTVTNETIKAKDNIETIYPTLLFFNISAVNGQVTHAQIPIDYDKLDLRTPSGSSNVGYGYTSYGTFITRSTPSGQPPTLDIDYPAKQREALVYLENGGTHSKLLSDISLGQHNVTINCTDIFGSENDYSLTFNYSTKPNITSYFPLDGSTNISVNANIILNFSKSMGTGTLNRATIAVKELNGDVIKRLFTYNDSIKQSILHPIQYFKFNTTYLVNVTTNVKDSFGNILDKNYVWNFTTATKERIIDTSNFIKGNMSDINTNIPNLIFKINDSENISSNFEGKQNLKFYQNGQNLLEFDYVFSNSSTIDLANISILNASNSSLGGVVVRGIDLSNTGIKKTAWVERVDSTKNGICIKDAEIDWVDNISDNCDGDDEHKIECDGSLQNGYTCAYNSLTNYYKVTGLSHSGVVQLAYTQPASGGSSGGGSSSGGGGGGSGGGGGGGGAAAGFVCNKDWQCGDWSRCNNGLQTRECNFVKVPQHVQDAECPQESNSPIRSQSCAIKTESIPKSQETIKQETNNKKEQSNESKNQITGLAVQQPLISNKITSLIVSTLVFVLGGFFYYKFFRVKI